MQTLVSVLTDTALLARIYIPPSRKKILYEILELEMPDVNPKIAFHINGDEHQVNIKLCYISNCATTYCQTLCKTTSDRRYI